MPVRKEINPFDRIVWFDRRIAFEIDYFELLQPRREVSHGLRYKSGLYRSRKCGREIQYESSLELRFVQMLEHHANVRFFWDQPVKIPYRRGRRKVFYTPDYGIYLDTGHVVLAEVKELAEMLDYRVQQKTEALIAFCAERGFGMLLTDGRHTPRDLLRGSINRRLERALLKALAEHPLPHAACRELMERCRATPAELYKAVIRQQLRFRSFPMRLQRGNAHSIFWESFFGKGKYDEVLQKKLSNTLNRV